MNCDLYFNTSVPLPGMFEAYPLLHNNSPFSSMTMYRSTSWIDGGTFYMDNIWSSALVKMPVNPGQSFFNDPGAARLWLNMVSHVEEQSCCSLSETWMTDGTVCNEQEEIREWWGREQWSPKEKNGLVPPGRHRSAARGLIDNALLASVS